MTNRRFVCIGDLHLTSGPQNVDRIAALDYVLKKEGGNDIDAWLWPGDVTDSGMTIDIRNLLVDRVTAMANVAPVVIVPGNHDPAGDLDFLSRLRTQWPISIRTIPGVVPCLMKRAVRATEPAMALFCLPYPNKARIVAAGTPPDSVGDVASKAFDAIFMEAGGLFARCRDAGQLTGVIGHVTISGAVASTGQPQIGSELSIDAVHHLSRLGDCFKVFNHIHKHQRIGSAVYVGSMCRMDWGEIEPKGYVVIECVQDDGWSHSETFVPIPVPAMYHVEGSFARGDFEWHVAKGAGGVVDNKASLWDMNGADVRVRVSYPAQERARLDDMKARIRKEFQSARRLVIEPMPIQDRALRSAEVVHAKTLNDKLRAWAQLSGVSWSDHVARCADTLDGYVDADAVVADVEREMSALVDSLATE